MIRPGDPWYPNPYKRGENCPHQSEGNGGCPACLGVTIRLKLAVEMANSPQLHIECLRHNMNVVDGAFYLADAMIERENRDEGSDDDVRNV